MYQIIFWQTFYKQCFLSVEPFCVNLPASFKNVLQFVSVIKMFIIFCENGYKNLVFLLISNPMNKSKKMHWQSFANRKKC